MDDPASGRARRSEEGFRAGRQAEWSELDLLLTGRALARRPATDLARALHLYRALTADLMRARAAGFSLDLLALLDGLAARGHAALYTAPSHDRRLLRRFFTTDFPRAVRARRRMVLLSALLFVAPGALGFTGALGSRAFAAHILPEPTMDQMEQAYGEELDHGRTDGGDTAMAGFYVYNNIGIAFRCFATGIFFGLGSLIFLVYNGLMIGAVMGLVTASGNARNIFTFTCGHAALELGAIVLSGAAGLHLGWALVDTRGRTRLGSLRAEARGIAEVVMGAAVMLALAALVEGYWSPSAVLAEVKWVVAGAIAAALGGYFALAGRGTRV